MKDWRAGGGVSEFFLPFVTSILNIQMRPDVVEWWCHFSAKTHSPFSLICRSCYVLGHSLLSSFFSLGLILNAYLIALNILVQLRCHNSEISPHVHPGQTFSKVIKGSLKHWLGTAILIDWCIWSVGRLHDEVPLSRGYDIDMPSFPAWQRTEGQYCTSSLRPLSCVAFLQGSVDVRQPWACLQYQHMICMLISPWVQLWWWPHSM